MEQLVKQLGACGSEQLAQYVTSGVCESRPETENLLAFHFRVEDNRVTACCSGDGTPADRRRAGKASILIRHSNGGIAWHCRGLIAHSTTSRACGGKCSDAQARHPQEVASG
jgi:hypothetical protein